MSTRLTRAVVALAVAAVLVLGEHAVFTQAWAAFASTTNSAANTFGAASSFPTYAQTVQADSPSVYYRMDEAASTASSSAMADSSGASANGSYEGATSGATQWWRFNENTGSTTYDRAGGGFKGTIGSGATWTAGKYGAGLTFDGTANAYVASTTSPVRTDASFSVAVWVDITDVTATTGPRAVVSQGSGQVSGFFLKFQNNEWQFTIPGDSAGNGSWVIAHTGIGSGADHWVHLVAVYDAGNATVNLYVNGALADSEAGPTTPWNASGGLEVGRDLFGSSWSDPFVGNIDDVRVYNRALTQADVTAIYGAVGDPPAADWRFDDGDDAVLTDASGNGNTLNLVGEAGSPATRVGGTMGTPRALALNGALYAAAAVPVVRTDQSFTVSAWLRNDDTNAADWRDAITEPGANANAFALEYRGDNDEFGFSLAQTDVASPTFDNVYSTTTVTSGTWYYVTAVYDASAGSIAMYVNGALQNQSTRTTPTWTATQGTQVGRGIVNSAWATTQQWDGAIDGVTLYQRALSASDVTSLYNTSAPSGTMSAGQPGAMASAPSTAVAFNGTASANDTSLITAPTSNFSLECWFRTDSNVGGALVGFASPAVGQGNQDDKQIYLNNAGQLTVALYTGTLNALTTAASYNDGVWHHVVATVSSSAGTTVYVDGLAVVANAAMTAGEALSEYWRVGGESLSYWANRPSSDYFVGLIDEPALYPTVLTAKQVRLHYYAAKR